MERDRSAAFRGVWLPIVTPFAAGEIDLSHAFAPRLMFDDPSIMSLVQLFAAECADDKRYSRLYGDNLSIALLLALAALGRSFQHLVVDGAQQSGDDVALGGEGAAQLRERQICALGDVEQAHLGPALLGRALERSGEDAAFPGVVIEHGPWTAFFLSSKEQRHWSSLPVAVRRRSVRTSLHPR